MERAKTVMRTAPDLHEKVKAGEMKAGAARREAKRRTAPDQPVEQEQVEEQNRGEEQEFDDAKFILEHLDHSLEIIKHYREELRGRYKNNYDFGRDHTKEVANSIDPEQRDNVNKKARRLGKWLLELSERLEEEKGRKEQR